MPSAGKVAKGGEKGPPPESFARAAGEPAAKKREKKRGGWPGLCGTDGRFRGLRPDEPRTESKKRGKRETSIMRWGGVGAGNGETRRGHGRREEKKKPHLAFLC